MKAYTGGGDRGKTSLYSGERVTKSHPRVEACGDIDELNSAIGAMIATFPADSSDLQAEAEHIQSVLFVAGAWISTTPDSLQSGRVRSVADADTELLERAIERMDGELPRLSEFLLPGGGVSASLAHVARTVCRRAERHVVVLVEESSSEENACGELRSLLKFLNRLSTYLFVIARHLNRMSGVKEAIWERPGRDSASMVGGEKSSEAAEKAPGPVEAVIILGHGSRVPEAGRDMEKVADRLREKYGYPLVEVCSMSNLGPHLPEIFAKCVKLGAGAVLVVPYFLHSGMHMLRDIPEMLREEAAKHPGVSVRMGRGFGFDELLVDLLRARIEETRRSGDVREVLTESPDSPI